MRVNYKKVGPSIRVDNEHFDISEPVSVMNTKNRVMRVLLNIISTYSIIIQFDDKYEKSNRKNWLLIKFNSIFFLGGGGILHIKNFQTNWTNDFALISNLRYIRSNHFTISSQASWGSIIYSIRYFNYTYNTYTHI